MHSVLFQIVPEGRRLTLFEQNPWLPQLLLLFGALGLIAFMVYWARGARRATGFTIHVTEEDISFTGQFPPGMQQTVIDFLANDIGQAGTYQIRGHWELTEAGNKMLIIAVSGEAGRMYEQRIRNFLKLNLKGPL